MNTAIAVKPLEWREEPIPPAWESLASSVVGLYCIPHGGDRFYLKLRDNVVLGDYPTLAKAKAAAQADYESRILAALTPHGEEAAAPAPSTHVEGARYAHVGFQWRARASADDLWSPWRDGPCPALAPKGSETEERRVYALAATATEGSAE
jgi:hypothetical protein